LEDLRVHTLAQLTTKEVEFQRYSQKDRATLTKEFTIKFEEGWKDRAFRFNVVPGKVFITNLNQRLSEKFSISLTTSLLISHMTQRELDYDLINFFEKLHNFKTS